MLALSYCSLRLSFYFLHALFDLHQTLLCLLGIMLRPLEIQLDICELALCFVVTLLELLILLLLLDDLPLLFLETSFKVSDLTFESLLNARLFGIGRGLFQVEPIDLLVSHLKVSY